MLFATRVAEGICVAGKSGTLKRAKTVPESSPASGSFLAALRTRGVTAPLVVGGALNGAIFQANVEQELASTLRPGDVVVLDNLNVHKVAGARRAIESHGAQLWFLPPYSPDLKPIETVFSKFKHLLRSAEERTMDSLWSACGKLLDAFSELECRNHIRHCGYRYS
jgi:transposase